VELVVDAGRIERLVELLGSVHVHPHRRASAAHNGVLSSPEPGNHGIVA
jgi:hypothetical protein